MAPKRPVQSAKKPKPQPQSQTMLWLVSGGVTLLILIVGVGIAIWAMNRTAPPPAPPPPEPPAKKEPEVKKPDPVNRLAHVRWVKHTDPVTKAKVEFPGHPKVTSMGRFGHIADENAITIHTVAFSDSDIEIGLFTQSVEGDQRSPQQYYDEHQPIFPSKGFNPGALGWVTKQNKVEPGREFIISADKQTVLYRVVKGKKWAYSMFAMGAKPEEERETINGFFDSLRIVDVPDDPGKVVADPGKTRKITEPWKTHTSNRDGFKVEMPGIHIPGIQKGDKGRFTMSITGKSLSTGIEFGVIPVPGSTDAAGLEAFFKGEREAQVKDLLKAYPEGKAEDVDDAMLDGQEAKAFVFRSSSFAYHCRVCRSANRVLVVYAQGTRMSDEDVERFFKSFRLLDGK